MILRAYLKVKEPERDRVLQHDKRARARASVQNMTTATFPVVKMVQRNLRTGMGHPL